MKNDYDGKLEVLENKIRKLETEITDLNKKMEANHIVQVQNR